MNSIWSERIQGIETLYRSRELRFSDRFADKFKEAFCIDGRENFLELGCGPGALAVSLSRWYPGARITGIDRDTNFIKYAAKKAPDIRFIEGDITSLPFDDAVFDVAVSNTVAEHVEPSAFYKEQYRVLKEGGVCIVVLSSRKGITVKAKCVEEETDFESAIWEKTGKDHFDTFEKYGVGAYAQNEAEIPATLEKYGFRDVSVSYAAVDLTPDDPVNSRDDAYAMIDSERYNDLESADALSLISPDIVTKNDVERLKKEINKKYDLRKELYDGGIKQWDTSVSVIMVVRGVK